MFVCSHEVSAKVRHQSQVFVLKSFDFFVTENFFLSRIIPNSNDILRFFIEFGQRTRNFWGKVKNPADRIKIFSFVLITVDNWIKNLGKLFNSLIIQITLGIADENISSSSKFWMKSHWDQWMLPQSNYLQSLVFEMCTVYSTNAKFVHAEQKSLSKRWEDLSEKKELFEEIGHPGVKGHCFNTFWWKRTLKSNPIASN